MRYRKDCLQQGRGTLLAISERVSTTRSGGTPCDISKSVQNNVGSTPCDIIKSVQNTVGGTPCDIARSVPGPCWIDCLRYRKECPQTLLERLLAISQGVYPKIVGDTPCDIVRSVPTRVGDTTCDIARSVPNNGWGYSL